MASSGAAGFGYSSDVSSSMIQGFVSDEAVPEMFNNLGTTMEMIGFSNSKNNIINLHQHADWKATLLPNKFPPPSSSTSTSTTHFYLPHDYNNITKPEFTSTGTGIHSIIGAPPDCDAFPCEPPNGTHGLSLSLSSSANPSNAALLQSFDQLRRHATNNTIQGFDSSTSTDAGLFGKPQQQMLPPDGYLGGGKAANLNFNYQQQQQHQGQGQHLSLKNSKYLVPTQQLLIEFCSLGIKQDDIDNETLLLKNKQKSSLKNKKQWEEESGSGPSMKPPLGTLEFVELQKRKSRLLSMLEEVERRYRQYGNQMKGVVWSFEAVAGEGAARVYSALALKAMSRHFKCLKDAIMREVEATRKAMGEKDIIINGSTKGETPRLRMIDQALRQQRAFHQMGLMESHPWRPQRGLPERSVSLLRAWLFEHFLNPYPSDADKHILARQTGLSRSQVSNWFINARVRLWKPMVEEMYLEEVKEAQENKKQSNTRCEAEGNNNGDDDDEDENEKVESPRNDQCVNSNSKRSLLQMNNIAEQEGFGSVELDFSSANYPIRTTTNCDEMAAPCLSNNINYSGGGSSVSLTLGLQQEDDGHGATRHVNVRLAFPPNASYVSSLYPKPPLDMDDCQPPDSLHYSLFDTHPQNLPYTHLC